MTAAVLSSREFLARYLKDFGEPSRGLPARPVPLGEGVCLLRDRDSGKADDLVISALLRSKRGTTRSASDAKGGRRTLRPPMRPAWMFP